MAGDWIKMRSNLWDDPRIARICDITDQGESAVIGALYWLWATADQHTEDGKMTGLSLRQVDRKTGIQGFAQALCDIGWLCITDDSLLITNFADHNGESAKKRAQTAKRVAKHAVTKKLTQETENTNANSVSTALPREEKRRKDISLLTVETHTNSSIGKSDNASVSDVKPTEAGKMAAALRPHGIPVTPSHPELLTWIADGATIKLVLEAVELARMQKPAPEKIAPKYLTAIVRNMLDGPKPRTEQPKKPSFWGATWPGIEQRAKELGLEQDKDEIAASFKLRVAKAAKKAGEAISWDGANIRPVVDVV